MRRSHGRGVFAFPSRLFYGAEEGGGGGAPATPPEAAPAAPAAPPAAAPAVPAASAAPAPAAAPAAPAEGSQAPKEPDPSWLLGRLNQKERQTRGRVYEELGVKDAAEAKELIAKAKGSESKAKTEKTEPDPKRSAETARLAELEGLAKVRADAELAKLTPQQQALITKRAGDDPVRILSEIDDLNLLIASMHQPAAPAAPAAAPAPAAPAAAAPAAAPAAATPTKPLPAGASTSAAPATPSATPPAAPNHLEVYERLSKSQPFAAANYLQKHERTIYAQMEARRNQKSASR